MYIAICSLASSKVTSTVGCFGGIIIFFLLQRTRICVDEFNVYLSDEVGSFVHIALEESLDRDLIENNLDHLIERDIKIIVAFAAETDAVDMLCKASQAGLTTSEYAWILP